ncbi:MAG: hypothetical protein OEW35_04665 [Gammaproteobacteria bacterium]|nr:hypothetical protein [Gammaproteobacteria bacterium]MDH4254487.1 hypothetical protein [Gammaproteobacteria bacterium]MDH5309091.1 hypothetical protein [Gammaproteobacteria bacterium]
MPKTKTARTGASLTESPGDVVRDVLAKLIGESVAVMRRRHDMD